MFSSEKPGFFSFLLQRNVLQRNKHFFGFLFNHLEATYSLVFYWNSKLIFNDLQTNNKLFGFLFNGLQTSNRFFGFLLQCKINIWWFTNKHQIIWLSLAMYFKIYKKKTKTKETTENENNISKKRIRSAGSFSIQFTMLNI